MLLFWKKSNSLSILNSEKSARDWFDYHFDYPLLDVPDYIAMHLFINCTINVLQALVQRIFTKAICIETST